MLKSAKDLLATSKTNEIVDAAASMDSEIKALTKELDALKAFIREQGLKMAASTGENAVEIKGDLHKAQVVMVKAEPKAKKGIDLLASKAGLPEEVWNALFTTKTVVGFADDFEAKVAALPTAQKAVVSNLVEMTTSTPRVNLK